MIQANATTPPTPPPVLDRLGRPITADRIIAGSRAAGLRLERGTFLSDSGDCCCAAGGLAMTIEPNLVDYDDVDEVLDESISYAHKWGLSDGFEGLRESSRDRWSDPAVYRACYAIGQEVYARRHEAGRGAGEGEPTREE